jgi:hypothetical protein
MSYGFWRDLDTIPYTGNIRRIPGGWNSRTDEVREGAGERWGQFWERWVLQQRI